MADQSLKIPKCRPVVLQKFLYNVDAHFLATEITNIKYYSSTRTLLSSQGKKVPYLLASLQNSPQLTQGRVALS